GSRGFPPAGPLGGRASRAGAAPHGVKVQAGDDGRARGGARVPGRARRLTGLGFKRAATAEEGTGRGSPAGRGVSRGWGSNRDRRREWAWGGGRAQRPTKGRLRRTATAEEGAGRGGAAGRRTPRGRGAAGGAGGGVGGRELAG